MDREEKAIAIGGSLELVKLAFQLFLRLLDQSGMSEEQKAEFEIRERERFLKNKELSKPPDITEDEN